MKESLAKIRRLLPLLLMTAAVAIAGCSSGANGGASSSAESPKEAKCPAMEALASLDVSDITSIQYTRNSEGGIASGSITNPTQVADVYLRLKEVSITGKSDMAVLDDDLAIKLETSGKSLGFSFEGDILLLEDGSRYNVENLSSLRNYMDGLIAENTSLSASANSSDDYDVSKGFSKTISSDGSIEWLYFNDFMMTMPSNEKWSFEMNGDSVTFYLFSAQQEGYGGRLVTIRAFDMDDYSYEQLPSYHVAGVGKNVGKRFIAIYPTDVQWNGADSTQDADYRDLRDYLLKIGEGTVNSPLQTADSD